MPSPVFDQLNLISDDLDATVGFYRQLGLQLSDPFRTPAGEPFHASNKGGEGRTARGGFFGLRTGLERRLEAGSGPPRPASSSALRVADRTSIDQLYGEIIAAGHKGLQPPFDAFWGARYAIVEDPNGLAVGLMSPADDAHRSPPPF